MLWIIDFHKIYKLENISNNMGNLGQKIATLTLIGAGLVGCATMPSIKPVDLRNGYKAESYIAADALDLATSVMAGEFTLEKDNAGYRKVKTGKYLESAKTWNDLFDRVCTSADDKRNRFITEKEAKALLDLMYQAITEPKERKDYNDFYFSA